MYIFMHIPKTGGSTLRDILMRNYPIEDIVSYEWPSQEELAISKAHLQEKVESDSLKLIMGHFGYRDNIHSILSVPPNYMAFFREPVARFESHYNYLYKYSGHKLHAIAKQKNIDFFDAFLEDTQNQVTRFFARQDESLCDALKHAEHVLNEHFGFIGIFEKYDESLVLMKNILELKNIYYVVVNKTDKGGGYLTLNKYQKEKVKEYNQYDMKLYETVRNIYDTRFSNLINKLEGEISSFREENLKLKEVVEFERRKDAKEIRDLKNVVNQYKRSMTGRALNFISLLKNR